MDLNISFRVRSFTVTVDLFRLDTNGLHIGVMVNRDKGDSDG